MTVSTAVLISGEGSNLKALVAASRMAPNFGASIDLVITDNAASPGVMWAMRNGINILMMPPGPGEKRAAYDANLHTALTGFGIELVCLAGYMRVLSRGFVEQWPDRILNIHPSLLPRFKGRDAVGQALQAGVQETGCTVHIVTPEVDDGPVLVQGLCVVNPDDTHETLTQRIRQVEHAIYPTALSMYARGLQANSLV